MILIADFCLAACSDVASEREQTSPTAGFDRATSSTCTQHSFPDRDGDGWSDAVEESVGTSTDDAKDNPPSRGLHVVVVPFEQDPSGGVDLDAKTKLARADVGVLLDTTGSMTGTVTRLRPQLPALFAELGSEIEDVAVGLAGYGDFPMNDGANSQYDVPFYLVHRMTTIRTQAGMDSLVAAAAGKNVIVDGVGPWFASMRGGDEPEQGWEALRQAITGVGLTYPTSFGSTARVPPFSATTAHPKTAPAGEELGVRGGMGFREDATPILLMISDTNNHVASMPGTQPPSATRDDALVALRAAHARVVGLMAWKVTGHDDLTWIADATGAKVAPDAWGAGSARPSDCPAGKCCVVADDPASGSVVQPDPIAGECRLVFQSDRYDTNLASTIARAIAAVARGVPSAVSAEVRDGTADSVDVNDAFVERIEARNDPGSPCAGRAVEGATFASVVPGDAACFRLVPKRNDTVRTDERTAQRFDAKLTLRADGIASLRATDVAFVVPPAGECARGSGSGVVR
jgi:hypothetical protein